ncbi:MAG: zinc ribbon domain-containing protein [Clostridia bacterium]|nr:zinc ribbon domain-containing protein [Clostridia bacterium]
MRQNKIIGNCPRCGTSYNNTVTFCSKCGANLTENIKFRQNKQMPTYEEKLDIMFNDAQYCIATISKREKTSCKIWIITAVIQIILSIICFPFPFWIAALLNIWRASSRNKLSKLVLLPNKELISKYDSVQYGLTWIYNILLGGLIGIVGCIYDERTRDYVHGNRNLIVWYCNVR